jgi:hypothetical protein
VKSANSKPSLLFYSHFRGMKIYPFFIPRYRLTPTPSQREREITTQSLALLAQHFDRQGNRRDRAYNHQRQPRRFALIFVELVLYQQTNSQPKRDAGAADQHQFGNGYGSLFQFHLLSPSCFAMRFGSRRFSNLETPALLLHAF